VDNEASVESVIPADQEEAAIILRNAGWIITPPSSVKYGCFLDLVCCASGTEPDGCVIDEARNEDCIYADRVGRKENCKYWKAWTAESLALFWKGIDDDV
jgi:hypothetical protein